MIRGKFTLAKTLTIDEAMKNNPIVVPYPHLP